MTRPVLQLVVALSNGTGCRGLYSWWTTLRSYVRPREVGVRLPDHPCGEKRLAVKGRSDGGVGGVGGDPCRRASRGGRCKEEEREQAQMEAQEEDG